MIEQQFRIPGPIDRLSLFLRFMPARTPSTRPPVLYVHGATFPSALSIAYRFGDGRSWRDALNDAGFDVWGLDFYGFGESDRYPEMSQPAADNPALCVTDGAMQQVEAAARFILAHHGAERLSLISHSWGSMPTAAFAARHPDLTHRLVLFAPIGPRGPRRYEQPATFPAWRIVTLDDQWTRFTEDVPAGQSVLPRNDFDAWGEQYLASDPGARTRTPAGVKTPLGPFSEIIKAWHGQLPYDPARVTAPLAIIRGEWDGLLLDDDARRLFDAFTNAPDKRDIKIARGTHLMHLETMRTSLWQESANFLAD